ncbi:MAG: DUF4440 domain-containing protein [Candidatus Nomurabacteria bacterium]
MDELKKIIYKLETDLLKPEVRSSFKTLDEIIANDFIEYGSSGLIYNKDMILERLPKAISPSYSLYDFEVIFLAENIIQTRFKTDRINLNNTKTTSFRSSIWKNTGKKWQIIFHQGTPINYL